jgi:hypothetical protein
MKRDDDEVCAECGEWIQEGESPDAMVHLDPHLDADHVARRVAPDPCKHCGKPGCRAHCQETADGCHVVDRGCASSADDEGEDDEDIVIDFPCVECGLSGSMKVTVSAIDWE